MPTYEYRCAKCGATFTQREPISAHTDRRPTCPKCQSADVEQQFGSISVKTAKKS
jgi:putative FmdB family regulatory protein